MFVLGIDPGLSTTGYGVVSRAEAGTTAAAAGVIRTDAQAPTPQRLLELHRDIQDLILEHEPEAMAVERLFVNRNLHTASGVARASGVILLAAAESELPVHEYTPSQVKTAVAGYGNAPKDQVNDMVATLLGLEEIPGPPDAADALAAALCHLQAAGLARAVEQAR